MKVSQPSIMRTAHPVLWIALFIAVWALFGGYLAEWIGRIVESFQ